MCAHRVFRKIFGAVLLIILITGWAAKTAQTQFADKPVEQVRKNIQVLQGLPDSQLFLVMNFVGDSLGVNCDYCHVRGDKNPQTGEYNWLWEKDDKPMKLVGREQMRMTLDLNRANFKGAAAVTCYTCHHGSLRPERMAPLPPRDYFGEALRVWESPSPSEGAKKSLPTAQEVVAKYLSAVGANRKDVLAKALVMKGVVERIERAKASGPIEIIFKQPNNTRITEPTGSGTVTRGTNGTAAWSQTAKGVTVVPPERVKSSVASLALFNPIKLPESLSQTALAGGSAQLIVSGIVRVNDRDAYFVTIDEGAKQSTQLFFDVETGLLLRRVNVTNTMLGPLNVQWDFSDYRNVNGVKLPFVIRTADVASYDTVVRRFSEIRIDPTLDDSIFDVPRAPSP
jgi:photosynthetic reaction center cytochrome c subunit